MVPSKSRLARCSAGFYTRPELLDPDFLAPEEFSQGYFDQSVDIYKAPAVAHWILEWAGQDGIDLLKSLESIHNQCKVKNSKQTIISTVLMSKLVKTLFKLLTFKAHFHHSQDFVLIERLRLEAWQKSHVYFS